MILTVLSMCNQSETSIHLCTDCLTANHRRSNLHVTCLLISWSNHNVSVDAISYVKYVVSNTGLSCLHWECMLHPYYSIVVHDVCMLASSVLQHIYRMHGYQKDMPNDIAFLDRVVRHLLSWRAVHLIDLHLATADIIMCLSASQLR